MLAARCLGGELTLASASAGDPGRDPDGWRISHARCCSCTLACTMLMLVTDPLGELW